LHIIRILASATQGVSYEKALRARRAGRATGLMAIRPDFRIFSAVFPSFFQSFDFPVPARRAGRATLRD
jgi:hypothetical protein